MVDVSQGNSKEQVESSNIGDSIGLLFDMPILPNDTGPDEEEFRRQMQQKKKGRRM